MNRFIIYFFCLLACFIGLTGTLKGQGIHLKSSNQKHDKSSKKSVQPNTKKHSTPITSQKKKQTGGIAFTCPAAKWSGLQADFYYHFTLTHITTQNPTVVKHARKTIQAYIASNVPLKNGHRSLSWIQPGTRGVNSLFFKGEAADFKLNLHNHLMQDPIISPYISPYISAHVDVRGDFSKHLYSSFTVDQMIERKTP